MSKSENFVKNASSSLEDLFLSTLKAFKEKPFSSTIIALLLLFVVKEVLNWVREDY